MTIGDRIKYQRESLGISQTELANKVNISKQTLYKYETNIITNIPSNKIEEIGKVLNVSPAYLMGWENKQYNTNDNFPLTTLEKKIIQKFRILNESERAMFLRSIGIEDEKGENKKFA